VNLKFVQWRSLKTKVTLFTLSIFVISIWSLAFYASQMLREDILRLLGEQQFSTVSLLAKDINGELETRFSSLETVAATISPELIGNQPLLQRLLEQRPIFQRLFNGGIFVTGSDGVATASVPLSAERAGVSYMDRDYILVALKDGLPMIGRPVMGRRVNAPIFGMSVPIRNAQGNVIGALAGITDLSSPNFLDKITKGRYGKTGDYLLAAPQYNLFVTASDKTRVMRPLPERGVNPVHDSYVSGYEGYGVLVNFRGEEELTAAKGIPVAGWFLGIALPSAEAFAPIRVLNERMLLATILLTLLAGGLTWWMLKRQLSPMLSAVNALAALADSDQPLKPLRIARQDEIGQLIGGFNRLLDTLRQREAALTASEARLRCLTEMSSDFFWETDAEHRLTRRTESPRETVERVFLHTTSVGLRRWEIPYLIPNEAGWLAHRALLDAHLPFRYFEIARPRVNGTVHHISVSGDPVFDVLGNFTGYQGIGTDVTARKAAEDQIRTLAFFDPLTGLPNRRLLMDRLKQAVATHARHLRQGALLFVDLDNFKTLNDTLGHDTGDMLLQQVAQSLSACIRDSDTVARLGGDEFVVMLEDLSESPMEAATQAEAVGEKILVALNKTYLLGGYEYHSTPSIGITLFGQSEEGMEEPLKRADLAMYQAKAAGRNTMRFFDPQMQAVVTARAALQVSLGEALEKGQFILYYQAQVGGDGTRIGAEALVRWLHPQRGLVSPCEFIPLAEETGMILRLGHWVLETACTQLAQWAVMPEFAMLTIAVNVSPRQFNQDDFVDQVLAILARTGARPQRLKLELTESLLVANVEDVIAKMGALKTKGVGFSLDDFGTGYSSLSHLKRLPLDQLKIDQSFVRDILIDANDAAIAKMIIALSASLGLAVIAEGVETEAQRHFLARHGCHACQGYLFSHPLPIAEFEAF
jgi:diguanylate cyclase (GGDEF)-like protein